MLTDNMIKVLKFFIKNPNKWFRNKEIASNLKPFMKERTIRKYTKILYEKGILEKRKCYPSPFYFYNSKIKPKDQKFLQELLDLLKIDQNRLQN